ncbi:hypothetical protein EBT25_10395 [bacterium]|nr:hypothetical protein [bacterium]
MLSHVDQDIVRFTGSVPGPSILIIGGIHGNERTGIAVVRRLQEELLSGKRFVVSGTLTIALGNPLAIAKDVRCIESRDLNRYFSAHALSHDDGSYEFIRANILAKCILEADVTLDIHATNKPSVPFVASKHDEAHQAVYRWFQPEHVLVDPAYIFGGGEPVTTEEYADVQGKVGLCLETGLAQDESVTPKTFSSVVAYLTHAGVFGGEKASPPEDRSGVYQLTHAILREERPFSFANGRGMRSFEPLLSGQVLGYHGDEPVYVREEGVLIFPKLPEHQQIGKPVCYLAKKIEVAGFGRV